MAEGDILAQARRLRREARALYEGRGLHAVLCRYGTPQVTGSYALDLMTWRDLDIYLQVTDPDVARFFALGGEIARLLQPVRMSYRDERSGRDERLPTGLYWGTYLDGTPAENWKIDLWAVTREECARLLAMRDEVSRRLTPRARLRILRIKSALWQDPRYRREFHGTDIYSAVLDHGVESVEGFFAYLEARRVGD